MNKNNMFFLGEKIKMLYKNLKEKKNILKNIVVKDINKNFFL